MPLISRVIDVSEESDMKTPPKEAF